MSKLVKEMLTRELAERYGEQTNALWLEMIGVDGITTNDFRREVRARKMRLEVVKTSLLRRACSEGPMALFAGKLNGPTTLLTGGESAIDAAKLVQDWLPKFPKETVRLRGALLEGEYVDETSVKDLHRMPGKRDLQARIVGLVISPGGRVVSCALAPARGVAGCVKALVKKLEQGEEIKASA